MFRMIRRIISISTSSPHTRGDVPYCGYTVENNLIVLPTRVGMFRRCKTRRAIQTGSPHTRGDVPDEQLKLAREKLFSPHAWGCSVMAASNVVRVVVLPTRVGMFHVPRSIFNRNHSSPHTRGDVPYNANALPPSWAFSPHAWGCSEGQAADVVGGVVLPTPVGMFRSRGRPSASSSSFPHARGDVPLSSYLVRTLGTSGTFVGTLPARVFAMLHK